MNGVCTHCGSVGFRCVVDEPTPAGEEELWIAEQARRLLALPTEFVARCSSESLREGLLEVVKSVYGGSVVRASQEAGLSRASVSTWLAGDFSPGLPWLLQLCFHARADVCALIDGVYTSLDVKVEAGDKGEAKEKARKAVRVVPRAYRRAELTDAQIRGFLSSAATEAEPPSLAQFARRHGLNEDTPRKKFAPEAMALVVANAEHMELVNERRYMEAVHAYTAAVKALLRQGLTVHAKSVQKQSGVVAFSQNTLRVRALKSVLDKHREETVAQRAA